MLRAGATLFHERKVTKLVHGFDPSVKIARYNSKVTGKKLVRGEVDSRKPTQLPCEIDRPPEHAMPEGPPTKVGEFPAEPNNLVYILKFTNYKAQGSSVYHPKVSRKTLMVADTGAGPNCVLYEALPMESRLKIHKRENYHL